MIAATWAELRGALLFLAVVLIATVVIVKLVD